MPSVWLNSLCRSRRWVRLSGRSYSSWSNSEESAYEVLGLSQNCNSDNIRIAFQKLAKKTHPDLQPGPPCPTTTAHFIRVLAAYQILSNPQRRAKYDADLSFHHNANTSQRKPCGPQRSYSNNNKAYAPDMEVVEWLRQYRSMVADLINQERLGEAEGLRDYLHGELKLAVQRAYFGPDDMFSDSFPNCFEAEERSHTTVADILHLVYARDHFGSVRALKDIRKRVSNKVPPFLSTSAGHVGHRLKDIDLCHSSDGMRTFDGRRSFGKSETSTCNRGSGTSEVSDFMNYADLELLINGKPVARSTRKPAQNLLNKNEGNSDCITVYSCLDEAKDCRDCDRGYDLNYGGSVLGIIEGLERTDSRSKCLIHGPDGNTTHMVIHYKTPMVKHMYWYNVTSNGSPQCECRCRRAWMLPSRYWIFEPRCASHNIGSWYIELFSRKKDQNKASHLLHPAVYILGIAYKTLDEEAARKHRDKRMLLHATSGIIAAASKVIIWLKNQWTK